MAFITMMIARLAGKDLNGDPAPLAILGETADDDVLDANIFLGMVIYGYFFIALVQLVGIFGGDRSPLQVRSVKKGFQKITLKKYHCLFRILSLRFVDFYSILELVENWLQTLFGSVYKFW